MYFTVQNRCRACLVETRPPNKEVHKSHVSYGTYCCYGVKLDVSMPSFQMSVLASDVIAESSKTNSF